MLTNIAIVLVIILTLLLGILGFLSVRQPIMAKLGVRNIPRRPTQSLLIIIGLTLSTVIIISSLSTGDTLDHSVTSQAVEAYGEIDEILSPPLLATLAQFGVDTSDIDNESGATNAESTPALFQGGLTSIFALLDEGLPGISEARYAELRAKIADEPLIESVAPAIIFPTIVRDVNSGQGEPFGFIFAVDDEYQTQFGLRTLNGEPADMTRLRPGVGNIFELSANLFSLTSGSTDALAPLITEFDLSDQDIADLLAGVAMLRMAFTGQTGGGNLEQSNLEDLGLDALLTNPADLNMLSAEVLSTINLNTLGMEIDQRLGQFGLALRQGDVYLNRIGAERLNARVGDTVEIHIGPLPVPYRVAGIVDEAGPMAALSPVVVMPLDEAQQLLFMVDKVNAVLVSNQGDAVSGIEHTAAVNERLRVLALNEDGVTRLFSLLREPAVKIVLETHIAAEAEADLFDGDPPPAIIANLFESVIPFDRFVNDLTVLQAALNEPDLSDDLRLSLANRFVQIWLIEDVDWPETHADEIKDAVRHLSELELLEPLSKQTVVTAANVGGVVSSSIFSLFGIFSILAAVLLIFLIFVMLAAERRSEMGIARAIGVQRRHLVQMFVTEGIVYDLAAAALGVALGLAISYAMIGFIGGLFNDLARNLSDQVQSSLFTFRFKIVPTSVIIAYCLGVLLTFLVVTFASWRMSHLNIVAAIRDLPESNFSKRLPRWRRLWPIILAPILLFAGVYLAFDSGTLEVTQVQLGISLGLTGLALLLSWILARTAFRPDQRDRVVYSLLGLGLLAIWAIPWSSLLGGRGSIFQQDPSAVLASFALTGPLIILGAILTVMFNADGLLWLVNRLFGGIGPLTPVLKIAIAYPLHARFRTGMAMLLFAMIITTVTIMAIVIRATQATVTPAAERSAGFEIEVSSTLLSFFNPITDLSAQIAGRPDFPAADVAAVARISRFNTVAQQPDSGADDTGYSELLLTGLNQDYLEQAQQIYTFQMRAPGFESDAAVWQALRERDNVAIVSAQITTDETDLFEQIEASAEDPTGDVTEDTSSNAPDDALNLPRLNLTDLTLPDSPTSVASMPEIMLELQSLTTFQNADTSTPQTVQVIGVLAQNTTLAGGVFQVNERLIERLSGAPIAPDNFYVKVHDGVEVRAVAQAIERAFLSSGLDATVMAEEFAAGQALTRGILQLFQGFMALGLLVGIAALGVISSRTVVERRQQVGMLRAIGYQPRMVALLFVMESSFIAVCGLGIGAITGLILGQNIIAEFYAFVTEGQGFSMPWLQISLILLGAYLFAMLTTIVPAVRASRIYPAEALRYS